nr:SAV_915 family protein [Haloechinothrix aidingensis]
MAEHTENPEEAVVELRRTRDGRMALMAYSAMDRLKYCCGEQQPWMVLPTAYLDNIQQVQPFDLVLLDVIIPEEHRHGSVSA